MKTIRKPVALALALVLSLLPNTALAAGDMGNFQRSQAYTAGQFTDVAQGEWYAESVKTAYELGLVKGSSDTTFAPGGSITVAATLALACRLHSIYETGAASFTQGDPWYQVYVDYAQQKGIFSAGAGVDFNAATRRQFASILAKALPAEALTGKNSIPDGAIPDVAMTDDSAADIYALYRAGVLTGNDALGTASIIPERPILPRAAPGIRSMWTML